MKVGNRREIGRKVLKTKVTVFSLNPAVDVEWAVDEMRWEEKNMVLSQRRWAGGKGANVVRWLRFLGDSPELLIPLGGITGEELRRYLREDKIRSRVVPLRSETRANVVITNRAGRQMRFNQDGARVTRADWKAILHETEACCRHAKAVVLSGSLPPGAPVTGYAQIARIAHQAGVRVFADCDGATLAETVKARPFLLKPNRHELSGWAGRALKNLKDVEAAARRMSEVTGGWVLVSLGAQGAMLVHAQEVFAERAYAENVKVVNTLGAGDATLAGAVHAVMSGGEPAEWLTTAVACGTAATQAPAGQTIDHGL